MLASNLLGTAFFFTKIAMPKLSQMTLSQHETWQNQINCKQLCLAKHNYTLQSCMPENSLACVKHIHCPSSDDRALIATLWVGVEYFDIFGTSVFWEVLYSFQESQIVLKLQVCVGGAESLSSKGLLKGPFFYSFPQLHQIYYRLGVLLLGYSVCMVFWNLLVVIGIFAISQI